jgi:hypothetical protein
MPDFDVNEGYTDPGADRADQSAESNDSAESDGFVYPGEGLLLEEWLASMYGPIPAIECVPDPAADQPRPMPERTPVVARIREGGGGHLRGLQAPRRRVQIELIAWRRMHARRACPFGHRVRVLGRPLSTCRQLPSKCHGQRPSPQEFR